MEWQEFFAPNLENVEKGNYAVFESAYQERIFNWFKRNDIDQSQKEIFIEKLLSFQDKCGRFYNYQGYFLAAKYMNVFKNSEFADEIVAQLLYWSFDFFRPEENEIDIDRKLEKEAQQSLKYTDINRVVNKFVDLIKNTNNEKILLAATQKLIELEPNNQIAISALVKTLLSTEDSNIVFKKLGFLVEFSIVPEDLTNVLVNFLHQIQSGDSTDIAWVSNTFYFLKKIAVGNKKAIDALIQLIERLPIQYPYEDEYLCEEALKTLGMIGKNNHRAINALTNFLQNNPPDSLSCLAARALWYIDPGNLLAVDTCTHLLETATDTYIIRDAALFLLKEELNGFTSTEAIVDIAINRLVDFIQNSQWIDIVRESISALEKISKSNEAALQGLFQLLETIDDDWVRLEVANSILRIDYQNQKALTVFYRALSTIEEEGKLYHITKKLLDIAPRDKIALDVLKKLLKISKKEYTRLKIAKHLINLDSSNQTAINTLRELIYLPRLHDCLAEQDLALPILERLDLGCRKVILLPQ